MIDPEGINVSNGNQDAMIALDNETDAVGTWTLLSNKASVMLLVRLVG